MSPKQTARIQASTRNVPGFRMDVPGDICLEWAARLVGQLALQEPVTVMEISAGGCTWYFDARTEKRAHA